MIRSFLGCFSLFACLEVNISPPIRARSDAIGLQATGWIQEWASDIFAGFYFEVKKPLGKVCFKLFFGGKKYGLSFCNK
ncbi:MAG: hypothetical protein VYA34_16150 [Myxococcota bacterium]|nr:hypothetical protein [Myxococcota bacterium]